MDRTNTHSAASARMGQRPAGTAQANECSVTVMSFRAQIDQSLLVGSMAISSARPTLGSDQLAASSNSFTALLIRTAFSTSRRVESGNAA
jgi:hypothetical protein